MKIIHLIETLAVEGGGGDRACLELASAQCALNHEVMVICFQDSDETPMIAEGVNIQRFDRSDRAGLRQAISKACSTGGDVVHVHGAWRLLQTWARRICKRHHTPYVFQPHGLFSEERLVHKRFRKQIWFSRHGPLADLVAHRKAAFPSSGEINFTLADPKAAIARVRAAFETEAISIDEMDGLGFNMGKWRFNLRSSNTEPVVRLNVEARGDAELVRKGLERVKRALLG